MAAGDQTTPPGAGADGGPLAGVRVLDLTSVILGPYATQILAGLGAEVIKVEPPEGDVIRRVGPARHADMGPIFLQANAGKRSLVLDLKHPDGRAALLRLATRCDVFISNIRPQALSRLGLDPATLHALNPALIHVTCCGFGQDGPYADRPAYDDLIQGATGIPWLMQAHGVPEPRYAPLALADRVTGLHAVYAVTTALYARSRSGRGQAVTVPMFESMAQLVLGDHLAGLAFDPPLGEPGYTRLLTPQRRPFPTADGHLCVLVYNDRQWRSFFAAIGETGGLGADPRFADHGARARHIEALYAEVARHMARRTTAQWQALLDAADIPHLPMYSPQDLLADPHLRASGFVHTVEHPSEGRLTAVGMPVAWSDTTAAPPRPAPRLGEHSREILAEAGCSEAEIAALLGAGVTVQA